MRISVGMGMYVCIGAIAKPYDRPFAEQVACGTCPDIPPLPFDQEQFKAIVAWQFDPATGVAEIYINNIDEQMKTAGLQLTATCISDPSVEFLQFTEELASSPILPPTIGTVVSMMSIL